MRRAPVLPDGVVHCLFGEAVFEFEGQYRPAVDVRGDVQAFRGIVLAVAGLAGDCEALRFEAAGGGLAAWHRCAVERFSVAAPVLDSLAEHLDGAASVDLSLETGQQFAARRAVVLLLEGRCRFRLGGSQKCPKPKEVDVSAAIVIVAVSGSPARTLPPGAGLADCRPRWRAAGIAGDTADQAFKASLGRVGTRPFVRCAKGSSTLMPP